MVDKVRTVEVEFLRPGPPQNQLLSPLTQYLAICEDAGAGTVTMPFEQSAFNRRLADLRYLDDDEQDQSPRLETLRTIGTALGDVLDAVPGLVGSLTDRAEAENLVNFRIVSSASELAMLPFELAKTPSGAGRPSDEWLALRAGTPICITRRERSVRVGRRPWPELPPKLLFIVGLEVDPGLVDDHREALATALAPWRRRGHDPLVCLGPEDATISNVTMALQSGVTAVHILAHGAESPTAEGERYGLLLAGTTGDGGDVVTGERLASVLHSMPNDSSLPSTIVVASCDSAYQADVLVPGGSFARALHVAGVPLVVASQFPLTFEGSTRLTELLYGRFFWGENPLPALASIRAALHAELASAHDWASMVVYDALPADFDEQLERVRYRRAKFAIDAALEGLDGGEYGIEEASGRAEVALARLPTSPSFQMEREGLNASYAKRMARHLYEDGSYAEARANLERAHQTYRRAARRFMQTGLGRQQWASLHWLETQAISLERVLGLDPEDGAWETSRRSAEIDLAVEEPDTRAWAHASLAELWLLRLFDDAGEKARRTAEEEAAGHVRQILGYYPLADDFHVTSTRRQFRRYVDWWSAEDFGDNLAVSRSERWPEVREKAEELVGILDRAAGSVRH